MKNTLLILATLFWVTINAQVGVNTPTPDQMLDVNGKMKISTDGKTPTAGTMRYTNANGFEGYTNSGWNSFTQKTNTLPSNPVPVTSFVNAISPNSTETCLFYDWATGSAFSTVPAGKFLIVTGIYPAPNSAGLTNEFYALSIIAFNNSGNPISYSRIRISSYDNESRSFSGDQAPLLVVKTGETLRVFNYSTSQLTMSLSVRGFLVDDLNY